MSVRVMTAVFDYSQTRLAARLVLLVIADRSDDDGTGCYRGKESIARMAQVDRATVTRAIQHIVDLGELEVEVRPGDTNEYRVILPGVGAYCAAPETVEGAQPAPGVGATTRLGRRNVRPNTSLTITNTSTSVTRVFEAWKEVTGKNRAVLDAKRRKTIERALELGYPEADLVAAVQGWKHSAHHRGENERKTVYNDIGLLLRDAAHIEQFRDLTPVEPARRLGHMNFDAIARRDAEQRRQVG